MRHRRVPRTTGVCVRGSLAALLCGLASVALASATVRVAERDWQSFDTGTLRMITDLPATDARDLLLDLHRFAPLVDRYVSAAPPVQPLRLVVFSRRADFVRLFRPNHFAAFTLPDLAETVLVVAPARGPQSLRENLRHEYVHYRLRGNDAGVPAWYEEGLASLLAAARWQGDRVRLGRWPGQQDVLWMGVDNLLDVRNVGALRQRSAERFYASAHGLVRYLHLQARPTPDQLDELLQPELDGRALAQQLAQPRRRINQTVRQDMSKQRESLTHVQLPAKPPPALPPAEPQSFVQTLATLAELTLSQNPKAAAVLYAALIEQQPESSQAWAGRVHALRMDDREEAARAALHHAQRLAPDAPDVLIAGALLGVQHCAFTRDAHCPAAWQRAQGALRRALAQAPERFRAIYWLGLAHLYLGQPGEALAYLSIAWQRAPWSPRVNYFLGEAYRLVGDSRARGVLENAHRWSAHEFFRASAAAALEAIAEEQGRPAPELTPAPETG